MAYFIHILYNARSIARHISCAIQRIHQKSEIGKQETEKKTTTN